MLILNMLYHKYLGPVQEHHNYTAESCSEQFYLALLQLNTDINITDLGADEAADHTVVERYIDYNGEKKHVSSPLRIYNRIGRVPQRTEADNLLLE